MYFLSEWVNNDRWNTWKVRVNLFCCLLLNLLQILILIQLINIVQIFNTPMGFASTNNPVESQNKQFKQFFTLWVILSVIEALKIIMERYLVTVAKILHSRTFQQSRTPTARIKQLSRGLDAICFVRILQNLVLYFSIRSIYRINVEMKSCTCRFFLAYRSCSHQHRSFELFDIQDASNKFVYRPKKGIIHNFLNKISLQNFS